MNMKIALPLIAVVVAGAGIFWWTTTKPTGPTSAVNSIVENGGGVVKTNVGSTETAKGTTLNSSNRGLVSVPADTFAQTGLTELDLSHNKLTGALQAEIRNLKNLKVLNLSNNQFTGVPAEIGQLSMLEVLDLSNNQLTGLPNELGNLSNLKRLILTGNEYSKTDLAVIQKKLPATTVITVD